MRGLKDRGLIELQALKNRVGRQYGLGRISQEDHDELKEMLEKMSDKIREMPEYP